MPLDPITQWLTTEGLRASPGELVLGYIARLNAAGVRLQRASLIFRVLHPQVQSAIFEWRPPGESPKVVDPARVIAIQSRASDESGEVTEFAHSFGFKDGPQFKASPFYALEQGAEYVRGRLEALPDPPPYPIFADLREGGLTDYLALPLSSHGEHGHFLSLATDRPGGFDDAQLDLLRNSSRIFGACLQALVNQRITETLLRVYLGADPGRKVSAGMIRRGDVRRISAALWFSDLRGFTQASESVDSEQLVAWLNSYFDAVTPPIEREGGEMLKFIGDAVLACFPVGDRGTAETCRAALRAAVAANEALDALNAERAAHTLPALRHGIALHVGEVQYGNIGSARRLDFTVIGRDVNLAARVESLCGSTGERLLATEAFAAQTGGLSALGRFALKGLQGEVEVFRPDS